MRSVTTLGDLLSEAQLRTLVKDYQVEQKYGTIASPARKRRNGSLSDIDAIRRRVQHQRHERQRGKLPKRSYLSVEEAIARFERHEGRLESREQMFAIGQGQATRKKTDIRATAIKGGRGGRITHRPTIDEGKGTSIRVRNVNVSRLIGYHV